MNTYPISTKNKHKELQNIKTILQNNNYSPHTYLNTKSKRNKNTTSNTKENQKWAKFTYLRKEKKNDYQII
jgi:hypothetical protein